MRYEIAKSGSAVVLKLIGEVVAADKGEFGSVIDKTIAEGGAVIVDMGQLSFMDSAGLGFLLNLWQKTKDSGVSVTISGASGEVKELLELSDFQILFNFE